MKPEFPMKALNESILDSSRPLVPDLPACLLRQAAGRRGSTTYIPVGKSTQDENAISILLQNQ